MKNSQKEKLGVKIKEQFREYHLPSCAYEIIEKIRKQFRESVKYPNHTLNYFIEIWLAIKVASILEAKVGNVKVKSELQDNVADAKILINEQELDFQITEAMDEGRKRDDEYKIKWQERINGIKFKTELVGNRFDAGETDGVNWIRKAVLRKAEKQYSGTPNLVVYANFLFEPENIDPQEIKSKCQDYREKFDSMWIVTDKHYLLLFDNHDDSVLGPISTTWETMPEFETPS